MASRPTGGSKPPPPHPEVVAKPLLVSFMLPITAILLVIPCMLTAHAVTVAKDGHVKASPITAITYVIGMVLVCGIIVPRWYKYVKNHIDEHDWKSTTIWRRLYAVWYEESPLIVHVVCAVFVYVYIGLPFPWDWWSGRLSEQGFLDPGLWGGLIAEAIEYNTSRKASGFDVVAFVEACSESMSEMLILVAIAYVMYAEYVSRSNTRTGAVTPIDAIPPRAPTKSPSAEVEWFYPILLMAWDALEMFEFYDEFNETGPNSNIASAALACLFSIVSTITELQLGKN